MSERFWIKTVFAIFAMALWALAGYLSEGIPELRGPWPLWVVLQGPSLALVFLTVAYAREEESSPLVLSALLLGALALAFFWGRISLQGEIPWWGYIGPGLVVVAFLHLAFRSDQDRPFREW